jgi:hypothetical protein
MNAPVRSFATDLRQLELQLDREGLRLSVPDRIRLFRELEHDLEACCTGLQENGLGAEEARRRAVEILLPGVETLRQLESVHRPLYLRFTAALDQGRVRRMERGALALTTAAVLVVQAMLLGRANLLEDASVFLLPVLGLGALLFALCAGTVFRLWVRRDPGDPGRGLGFILGLSGAVLLVALAGATFDTYRLASTLESSPFLATSLVTRWLVRECSLLAVAVLFALAGGLTWFILNQWSKDVLVARREALGLPTLIPKEVSPWA